MASISGMNRIDIAIAPSSYASATAVTSRYYNMKDYDRAIFIITAGSMPSTEYVECRLLQAPTSTAPAAAIAIGTACTIGSTMGTATYIKKAILVVLEAASTNTNWVNADTIVINNVTFTLMSTSSGFVGTSTSIPSTGGFSAGRYVVTSSNAGTPYDSLHHLKAFIDHGTYGCQGLAATVSGAASSILTIYPEPMGEKAITITASNVLLTKYSMQSVGYLECHGAELATSSNFDDVAVEVTPSTVAKFGAVLLRGTPRYSPAINLAYDDIV